MTNLELSQIFEQMANLLEMKEADFRSRAYSKVARILSSKKEDVKEIYEGGGIDALKKVPGIGQGIAQKIEEYLTTGKIEDYERLKHDSPVDVEELLSVEGVGPKTVKTLYQELGVKTLIDLKKAAVGGKIRGLEGFGEKTEKNILQAIGFAAEDKGRVLLGIALPIAREMVEEIRKLKEVKKAEIAGSLRRRKETVGDIDILAVSDKPEKVMDFFVNMPEVVKVWGKGETKSSVRLKMGIDCDLRVVKENSFGSAWQYFTGSRDHNIATRRIASEKKLKLSEYGVFKKDKQVAGKKETEVYKTIGLPFVPPEIREANGEIEAGLKNNLPDLVSQKDILGDCQCHSHWSDGKNSLEEIAKAGKKMGYEYIVVTDHAGFLKIANALDKDRLLKQMKAIDKVNRKISGIRLIKGCEVDINKDGNLALDDEILEKLEFVGASIHSAFRMDEKSMTKRLTLAIENPLVKVIFHPTGRIIQKREAYDLDLEQVFKAAKKYRTALELNAHIDRLDLNAENARRAADQGVRLTIGTDAHMIEQLPMMEFGVATARRAWLEKKHILNARSFNRF